MLFRVINNKFCYNLDNGNILREVIVKIGLENKYAGRSNSGGIVE